MRNYISFIAISSFFVCGFFNAAHGGSWDQWYTGSLLSPSGALFHKGDIAIEPYFSIQLSGAYFDNTGGRQNAGSHSQRILNNTLYKYAITDNLSIQTIPEIALWQSDGTHRHTGLSLGDTPVDAVLRFLDIRHGILHPAFNLFMGVGFPTGQYDRLRSPSFATGSGTYVARFALTEQSAYRLTVRHELRIRMWLNLRQPLDRVRTNDLSSYGSQSSHVIVGMTAEAGVSGELALTRQFVLAFDLARDFSASSVVRADTTDFQNPARRLPPSVSWNIAPAIEYNWSSRFGIIMGFSATVAGRNAAATMVPQFAFNAFF